MAEKKDTQIKMHLHGAELAANDLKADRKPLLQPRL